MLPLRRTLYLLLTFPLGLTWFVVLVVGFSLGAGLAVIGVGGVILVGMLWVIRAMAGVERSALRALVGADVVTRYRQPQGRGLFAAVMARLSDPQTWKDLVYLVVQFPLGILAEAHEESKLALVELRDLARGIHPAILTERGLGPAIEELAGRATVPVYVEELPDVRLPSAAEAAAYFVVAECLANVAKYARAGEATVRARREVGRVVVEVVDDGIGGADPVSGSGLRGLADRVEALGGLLTVASARGQGTTVRAEIPLAAVVAMSG